MKTRRGAWQILMALLLMAAAAWAADISGQWKAEWADYGQKGDLRQNTLIFKQDGANLTGSIKDETGVELPIQDGKVNGDTVAFVVAHKIGKREETMTYTGRIVGEEIKFKISFAGSDRSWEMTAKKAM